MINFGSAIKRNRLRRNIRQEDLAEKLNITSTYLSALENNRKEPSLSLLNSICKQLNIPREIFYWDSMEYESNFIKEQKKAYNLAKEIILEYFNQHNLNENAKL